MWVLADDEELDGGGSGLNGDKEDGSFLVLRYEKG